MSLIQATKTIGLKVISLSTGKQISTVTDIIYDPAQNRVEALLTGSGGWFSEAEVILTKDIQSIGPDAVMVAHENVVRTASEVNQKVASIAEEGTNLTKSKVVTTDGQDLGRVSDLFFDLPGGQVVNLQVSQGVFKNIQSGAKIVEVGDIKTIGEDAIIVSKWTEQKFEEQGQSQGLQGAVAATGAKLTEVKEQAGAKIEEIKNSEPVQNATATIQAKTQQMQEDYKSGAMEQGLREKAAHAKEVIADKTHQVQAVAAEKTDQTKAAAQQSQHSIQLQRAQGVKGKRVGNLNILNSQGQVVAGPGTIINDQLIAVAEQSNMLQQLIESAV